MKASKSPVTRALTDRQERFVHEYLVDQNATAAAARAGYSAKTKGTQAALMMKNPAIRQRIALGLGDLFARVDLKALEVLRRQVQQAYLDPAKLFDAGQRAIPLAQLDEDTRGGVTVAYALRDDGRQVMTVKQTPRHVALGVLQKRLENFEKLQAEVFAQEGEEEEEEEKKRPAAAGGGSARGFFDVKLQLDAPQEAGPGQVPQEAALTRAPQLPPPAVSDMAAADAEMARAVQALGGGVGPAADATAQPRAMMTASAVKNERAEPARQQGNRVSAPGCVTPPSLKGSDACAGAAAANADTSISMSASMSTSASVPASISAPASSTSAPAQAKNAAQEVSAGDGPPPSPFEPGYDFKKDPNAMYGGRFTAWNRYWREKRERELMAAEEQAALLNPPPNFRVGPGKRVPVRMEPGYNPPWLRNNRQEFAIGAGECWID